jgi:hypothetical protein
LPCGAKRNPRSRCPWWKTGIPATDGEGLQDGNLHSTPTEKQARLKIDLRQTGDATNPANDRCGKPIPIFAAVRGAEVMSG